jgi:hypothetical protein
MMLMAEIIATQQWSNPIMPLPWLAIAIQYGLAVGSWAMDR